jgi:hypothetical protein
MGRKHRGDRRGRKRGGTLTSLRGGFRRAAQATTGSGDQKKPVSPAKRALNNSLTIALVVVVAVLLLRRFGVFP